MTHELIEIFDEPRNRLQPKDARINGDCAATLFNRAILDALVSQICVLRSDGRIVAVNSAWERLVKGNGVDGPSLTPGMNYLEICNNADDPNGHFGTRFADGLRAMIRGERQQFNIEYPTAASDGRRWLEAQVTRLEIDQSLFLVISQADISDRKQTEEALLESQAELRATVNTAIDPIITVDIYGQILSANQAAQTTFGYAAEEMLDKHVRLLMPDAENDQRASLCFKPDPERVPGRRLEVVGQRKDGSRFPLELGVSEVRVSGVHHFVGILRDITERKRFEDQVLTLNANLGRRVAERTAELESMLDNAAIGLLFFDRERQIVRINRFLIDIFQRPAAALLGKTLSESLPYLGELVDPVLRKVLQTGQSVTGFEIIAAVPIHSNNRHDLLASFFPIRDAAGMIISVGAAVADVTRMKMVEESLRSNSMQMAHANLELFRASRMKDEFLASMSHELRTPLNGILGLSEGLKELDYGHLEDCQLNAIDLILQSGRHLMSLINDILDVAKVEAGMIKLEFSLISIEEVCKASLRLIDRLTRDRQQEVKLKLAINEPTMVADARRLKQILVNLLSNAAKFTAEGGKIGLDVVGDCGDGIIEFVNWDTGIGISEEDQKRLFRPFTQLDSKLSRHYPGTGLGLTLVQRFADLHGGSVRLKSKPGIGSRFTVRLPWRSFEEHPIDQPKLPTLADLFAEGSDNCEDASPMILIAEDNETNATFLAHFLRTRGFLTCLARDGYEAVVSARQNLPELILMDIQMPRVDGLQAIQEIRSDALLKTIPIIALTALAMPGDRERCLSAGADAYLSKPIDFAALILQMRTLLSNNKVMLVANVS